MTTHFYILNVPDHLTTSPSVSPFGVTCREIADLIESKLAIGRVFWVEFDTHTGSRRARIRLSSWFNTPLSHKLRIEFAAQKKEPFLCEGYIDPSTGNFVRFHDDACISFHSEPNPPTSSPTSSAPTSSPPPSLLETLDSPLSPADLLTLTKGLLQDLATDDLSRETLIWTAQPKLDAHYKRIHDFLHLLHTHLQDDHDSRIYDLENTIRRLQHDNQRLHDDNRRLHDDNQRISESCDIQCWRVQEGLPRFYLPQTQTQNIHPFDAQLKRIRDDNSIILPIPATLLLL